MPRDTVEGISGHKHYARWCGMNQRCYDKNDMHYSLYGALGIKVGAEWNHDNPKGSYNFIVWLEEQVAKLPEEKRNETFIVGRRDLKGDYSPDNCVLTTTIEQSQKRLGTVMTFEDVVSLRQYKKANPEVSVRSMCKIFGVKNVNTLSRCLQGVTWPNVNAVEAPLTFVHHLKKSK